MTLSSSFIALQSMQDEKSNLKVGASDPQSRNDDAEANQESMTQLAPFPALWLWS